MKKTAVLIHVGFRGNSENETGNCAAQNASDDSAHARQQARSRNAKVCRKVRPAASPIPFSFIRNEPEGIPLSIFQQATGSVAQHRASPTFARLGRQLATNATSVRDSLNRVAP